MNGDAIGAVAEGVGALGVIVTLAYLARQIHQNTTHLEQSTRSARAAAVNASNITLRENRQSIFEDEEMSAIFRRGNEDPESLSEIERLRDRLLMQNVTDAMFEIHAQTAVTDFSPETWQSQGVTLVRRVLGAEGGRWFWAAYADNYPSSFRSELERVLAGE